MAVLATAVAGFGVVGPLLDWHAERAEELIRQTALVQRMEALAARLPQLRQQAAAASLGNAGEAFLLAGDSDSTAGAALQESLQAMLLQAGVTLNSVETLPGDEAGPYRRVRLRVSFNASWPGLVGVLRAISAATPPLIADELQVQPALHRIGTAPGTFDVTCAVFGFRQGSTRVSAR